MSIIEEIKKFYNNDFSGIMYHDETNNFRLLELTQAGTNNKMENKSFVLGGIGCISRERIDCSQLLIDLNLQKTQKEFKFEHFAPRKHKTDMNYFLEILKSPKLKTLLEWIVIDEKLFFHYSTTNFMYYALSDIVDDAMQPYGSEMFFAMQRRLKSALYEAIKPAFDRFVKQLYDFGFPNIKNKDIKKFVDSILEYIEITQHNKLEIQEDFATEYLRQVVKAMRNNTKLLYLTDNDEYELYSDFSTNYSIRIGAFSRAKLVFDRELEVEQALQEEKQHNFEFVDSHEEKQHNFEFVDSHNEIMIQISDVIVGFVSKFLTYIEEREEEEIRLDFREMTIDQKELLRLFFIIEGRSDKICERFFNHIQPLSLMQKKNFLKSLLDVDR